MVAKLSPLVVIVGETASGKSALAMEIARLFNGEIICADSRTIYRYMDIGTAKPTKQNQTEVRHHLIDIIYPDEKYSAKRFKTDALKAIDNISSRGKLPILAGGTGLYVDAVIFDYQFSEKGALRNQQNNRHLAQRTSVKKNDIRPNTLMIGLNINRELLKNRIEDRIENMLKAGLEAEVKFLVTKYESDLESLSGIGYKTMFKYLNKDITLNEAKVELVKGDKSLAKRQRTWFKKNKNINWVDNSEQAIFLVQEFLRD